MREFSLCTLFDNKYNYLEIADSELVKSNASKILFAYALFDVVSFHLV